MQLPQQLVEKESHAANLRTELLVSQKELKEELALLEKLGLTNAAVANLLDTPSDKLPTYVTRNFLRHLTFDNRLSNGTIIRNDFLDPVSKATLQVRSSLSEEAVVKLIDAAHRVVTFLSAATILLPLPAFRMAAINSFTAGFRLGQGHW